MKISKFLDVVNKAVETLISAPEMDEGYVDTIMAEELKDGMDVTNTVTGKRIKIGKVVKQKTVPFGIEIYDKKGNKRFTVGKRVEFIVH